MRCSRHEGHVCMPLGMWEADKAAVSGEFAPGWLRLSCGLISDPVILRLFNCSIFLRTSIFNQVIMKTLLFSLPHTAKVNYIPENDIRVSWLYAQCQVFEQRTSEWVEFTNWKKTFTTTFPDIGFCMCLFIKITISLSKLWVKIIFYINIADKNIIHIALSNQLIVINRTQIKFCLHNICVYWVYIYKHTHIDVYI